MSQQESKASEKTSAQMASTASQIVEIDKSARARIEAAAKARENRISEAAAQKEKLCKRMEDRLKNQLAQYEEELSKQQNAVASDANGRKEQVEAEFKASFAQKQEALTDRLFAKAIAFEQEI